jgi:hypothetical protein
MTATCSFPEAQLRSLPKSAIQCVMQRTPNHLLPVWEVAGNGIGILVILQQPSIEPSTWVHFEHRRTLEDEQGLVRGAMPRRLL